MRITHDELLDELSKPMQFDPWVDPPHDEHDATMVLDGQFTLTELERIVTLWKLFRGDTDAKP